MYVKEILKKKKVIWGALQLMGELEMVRGAAFEL